MFRLKLALKADGIEMHVADHCDLRRQFFPIFAHEQILRPACASDQDRFAVDEEAPNAGLVELRADLTNAYLRCGRIRNCAERNEAYVEWNQWMLAHLARPPHFRMMDVQLRKFLWREGHVFRFTGGQVNGLLERGPGERT